MSDRTWLVTPPSKPGFYWFYGDVHHGGMGIDFRPDKPPTEPEMVLVEVFNIANGVMAKCNGQFVPLKRFDIDSHKAGPLGYWTPAELPESPADIAEMFKCGPEYTKEVK